jgi:hypothetical protein
MEIFGGGYDIPTIVRSGGKQARERYAFAFGAEPQVWEAASPSKYVQPGKNIPPFLLVYAGDRRASKEQALMLADVFEGSGLPSSGQDIT